MLLAKIKVVDSGCPSTKGCMRANRLGPNKYSSSYSRRLASVTASSDLARSIAVTRLTPKYSRY